MTVRIAPAAEFSHADRAALWTEAFSDYYAPGVFTAESLAAFERLFDLDPGASRLVLEADRPVAFAMLGLRGPDRAGRAPFTPGSAGGRGWVGGMGVIPAARRRGHGERAMLAVMDAARSLGLATLRLEVLVQNVQAIPLYDRLGFRTLRKVEVWERAAGLAPPRAIGSGPRALPPEEAAAILGEGTLDAAPWQRELGAALRLLPDLEAAAEERDGARAAVIHRTLADRVTILELGATPGPPEARDAALDALLAGFLAARPGRPVRLLNFPEGHPAGGALGRAGATVTHRQWEMELELPGAS